MKNSLRFLVKRTTFRFVSFYMVLILLPTSIFLFSYAATLRRQAIAEQRYSQEATLRQNTQFIAEQLSQTERITNTLQASTPLLSLLENRFISASDELFAYVSYIQPLLDSILMVNPLVTDLYIYRYNSSFIKNYGLVHSLCDIADYPYAVMPESATDSISFLATDPAVLRHDADELADGPRYVYLSCLYSQDYNSIIAVLELQMDVESLLFPTLTPGEGDAMYLSWNGQSYPVAAKDGDFHFVTDAPMTVLPAVGNDQLPSTASAHDLTFTWYHALDDRFGASSSYALTSALLLLLPMLLFCLYVYHFSLRITRFSAHIHHTEHDLPVPYPGKARNDEFGDVIRDYNAMTQLIREQVDAMQEAERLKNAANYYAMSSQVNPHFMFNTLENIRMHIEVEQYDEADQMLCTLGYFLRYNISLREESRLLDELEHTRHYLCIYQFRMNNMLSYHIHQEDDVPNVRCPFCFLQPIVENSLKHGIKGVKTPLHIDVHLYRTEDGVGVDVSDNGIGMSPEEIARLNRQLTLPAQVDAENHVGLMNVNARIRYFYGPQYILSFSPQPSGVVCHIRLGLKPAPGISSGHMQKEVRE